MPFQFNPITGKLDLVNVGAHPANSFGTIAVPNGTSPVATSSIDTLTLTSADGNIVITGNSSTDTVDFSLAATLKAIGGLDSIYLTGRVLIDQTGAGSLNWQSRTLIDTNGVVSLDYENRELFDFSGVTTVDYANRILFNGDGTTINWQNMQLLVGISGAIRADWGMAFLYDTATGQQSLDWGGRVLLDGGGDNSVLWNSRQLIDSPGTIAADWNQRRFYNDSGLVSVDWNSMQLVVAGSGQVVVDWGANLLIDAGSNMSIDWFNRHLVDDAFLTSVNWTTRLLVYANGFTAVEWDAGNLYDSSGIIGINWISRVARDASGNLAIDWANRLLKDTSGNKSVDWVGRTLYDSSLGAELSWTTSGVQINKTVTSYNGRTTQGEGFPIIEGSKTLNGQNATIASTNLVASALGRQYHIDGNLIVTTAGTGGTVLAQVQYTDTANQARTINLTSINLNTIGAESTINQTIWPKSGTAITYTSTVAGATGSPLYGLVLNAEVK